MAKSYRSELVGVFGCPVDENPTIVMEEAAFKAKNLNWRYITMLVKPENLDAAFEALRALNFAGVNLTIPHKVEALKYVDGLSKKAELIGAINTIINRDGKLFGENTDGAGFVQGMQKQGLELRGKSIVVLGAGGASRAICVECALAGAGKLLILNRTLHKADEIAAVVKKNTPCEVKTAEWKGTAHIPPCDILINATSIGLFPDPGFPDIFYEDITPAMIVQDIIPNPAKTEFLKKAKERGAMTYDGLSMLVEQGAIGFKLWTGQDAPTEVMHSALAKEFE
ncbi:shikimate dehydrogenase [Treponema primitia]|uniref:shikimate dehydrogenase n=1 Tax=Treponema primitia TaxID=88058 RepID=UPI000255541D|nr:shikimate dehydrogenase [Treponema primitia]